MPTPASSDGGGSFTGGTLTSPLAIDTATSPQLLVENAAGTTTFWQVNAAEGSYSLYVDPDGAGAPAMELDATGASYKDEAFTTLVRLSAGVLSLGKGQSVVLRNEGSTSVFLINRATAPADGTLNNGEMSLWFDKVAPGALKVKAKDEGGTVRSATIALA